MYHFLKRGINGRWTPVSRDSLLDPDLPEVTGFFLALFAARRTRLILDGKTYADGRESTGVRRRCFQKLTARARFTWGTRPALHRALNFPEEFPAVLYVLSCPELLKNLERPRSLQFRTL